MGLTATRVVFRRDQGIDATLRELSLPSQGRLATFNGYINENDWGFCVRPCSEGDWIGSVPELAIELSRRGVPCLILSVFDSDEVMAACMVDGSIVDAVSTSDCFGDAFDVSPPSHSDDCWKTIGIRPVTRHEVTGIVQGDHLFAEHAAHELLVQLGMQDSSLWRDKAELFPEDSASDSSSAAQYSGGPIEAKLQPKERTEAFSWLPNCQRDLRYVVVDDGIRKINAGGVLSLVSIFEPLSNYGELSDLCLRFLADLSDNDEVFRVRVRYKMQPDSLNIRKRKFTIKKSEQLSSKLQPLFISMPDIESLFVEVEDSASGEVFCGFVMQQCSEDPDAPGEPYALHLAVWSTIKDRAHFSANINQLGDAVAKLTKLYQAWICDWNWRPQFSTVDQNNDTPLEDALNEIRQRAPEYPMTQRHCRRYLRGFGHQVWLGPDIAKYILSVPDEVAIDQQGPIRKLSFADGAGISSIESVLAPVIEYPSKDGQQR